MIERVLAAAMFASDAPRVGNDHMLFDDLDGAEQRRFLSYAKIAITLVGSEFRQKSEPSALSTHCFAFRPVDAWRLGVDCVFCGKHFSDEECIDPNMPRCERKKSAEPAATAPT
jgi:hypothetical protein